MVGRISFTIGILIFFGMACTTQRQYHHGVGRLKNVQIPVSGILSSPFGERGGRMHKGIDIATNKNSRIRAIAPGKVVFVGTKGSFGKLVIVDHGKGYQSYYAHQSKILVEHGQWIKQGHYVGVVGSTGRSTGPHLHFEIRHRGKAIDPLTIVSPHAFIYPDEISVTHSH